MAETIPLRVAVEVEDGGDGRVEATVAVGGRAVMARSYHHVGVGRAAAAVADISAEFAEALSALIAAHADGTLVRVAGSDAGVVLG